MAFAIGAIAFAVGYRTPGSLSTFATKAERKPDVPSALTDHAPVAGTSSALSRDNLQVEGFAKIGFAEMEELMTKASPEQREQWAQELGALPDTPLKPIAWVAFYTIWLDLEPEAALLSLHKFPDLLNREGVFEILGSSAPATLLPQLIDVITELSSMERRLLLPSYLARLAQTDPGATARFINSHPKFVSDSDAAMLMSTWVRDDMNAAKKWLEGSQFSTESVVVRSLVDSWFAKDPTAAQNYVVLHQDDEGIGDAASSIALHLFKTSPEQTREFMRLFDDRHASQILLSLLSSVSDDQVANLATWTATLPGSVAEDSLGFALARWERVDPGQALDWLRAKPENERESLLVNMIRSEMAPPSPEMVALAYKIRDVQKRDEALSILVRSLTAETGDATEQIRALGLPPSQMNHLLELRPPPIE
ncbi:MAG: hypothetical protein ACJ8NS_12990 [Chthoniobacterales bacterium]